VWWLNVGCGGSIVGCGGSIVGCGGSMVVHQAVKPAVPGANPAYLQPAGTCQSLLGSQQGWHDNCRLASEGRQRQKNTKIKKKIRKEKKCDGVIKVLNLLPGVGLTGSR